MTCLLLYNPKAGKGRCESEVSAIVEVFRSEGIDLHPRAIVFGTDPFDGAEDVALVVVAGGDGTINYVVNCMERRGINPRLGIIPRGTANDFAHVLGMPSNPLEAARQIARGGKKTRAVGEQVTTVGEQVTTVGEEATTVDEEATAVREHCVDCGEVNGRRFVNVFSFGVLTTTSQQTSDRAKHRFGKLAYLWVGAKDLARMHPMELVITSDGERQSVRAAMLLVFNGRSAGRFRLAPKAQVDDGMFDVVVLDYRNMVAACWAMIRYLAGCKPKTVRTFRCRTLRIETQRPEPTDVDGQQGPEFPIELRCLPQILRIQGAKPRGR